MPDDPMKKILPVHLVDAEFPEEWDFIPGWYGYEASNMGRIRSLLGTRRYGRGAKIGKTRPIRRVPKILSNKLSRCGYLEVVMHGDNGQKSALAHRVIAATFLGCESGQVNHKNGIKTDNRLSNLEWCSASENIQHAHSIGLFPSRVGEKNRAAKLTDNDAALIKAMILGGASNKDVALGFGVAPSTIQCLRKNKTWSHVPWPNVGLPFKDYAN